MKPLKYAYIAIEGLIGVGKTTLAHTLAQMTGAKLVLEEMEPNPFLDRFYRNPDQFALRTQLHFLVSRYKQLYNVREWCEGRQRIVADYLFEKDNLFASVTLPAEDYRLYRVIQGLLSEQLPRPQCIVYLRGDVSLLLDRIRQRGKESEREITAVYLRKLETAYNDFLTQQTLAPVVTVDVDRVDLCEPNPGVEAIIERINHA